MKREMRARFSPSPLSILTILEIPMLVDIYARAMLHATRHADLPQRPLPEPAPRGMKHPSALRRALAALFRSWQTNAAEKKSPSADLCASNPNGCM